MLGANGSMANEEVYLKHDWYHNLPPSSSDSTEDVTDVDDYLHHSPLPVRKMRPERWARLDAGAYELLDSHFCKLVWMTRKAFISAVRNCASPQVPLQVEGSADWGSIDASETPYRNDFRLRGGQASVITKATKRKVNNSLTGA